jgi:hypothetical protein
MVGNGDGGVNGIFYQQVTQVGSRAACDLRWQPQHLVEISVVEITLPVHADHAAAHHRIKVLHLE